MTLGQSKIEKDLHTLIIKERLINLTTLKLKLGVIKLSLR